MRIKKSLPYDFCDTCDQFILKTDETMTFSGAVGVTERVITVYCKNAGKCGHLYKNLKKKVGDSHDDKG